MKSCPTSAWRHFRGPSTAGTVSWTGRSGGRTRCARAGCAGAAWTTFPHVAQHRVFLGAQRSATGSVPRALLGLAEPQGSGLTLRTDAEGPRIRRGALAAVRPCGVRGDGAYAWVGARDRALRIGGTGTSLLPLCRPRKPPVLHEVARPPAACKTRRTGR